MTRFRTKYDFLPLVFLVISLIPSSFSLSLIDWTVIIDNSTKSYSNQPLLHKWWWHWGNCNLPSSKTNVHMSSNRQTSECRDVRADVGELTWEVRPFRLGQRSGTVCQHDGDLEGQSGWIVLASWWSICSTIRLVARFELDVKGCLRTFGWLEYNKRCKLWTFYCIL